MELHGTIAYNLRLAVESARRLEGHPIHKDTLAYWSELVAEARARRAAGEGGDDQAIDDAIAELETVLSRESVP